VFLVVAHDGKRLVKVLLLVSQAPKFVQTLREGSKFWLRTAQFHMEDGGSLFVTENSEDLQLHFEDKSAARMVESLSQIQGLPIKYTDAPRFVFLTGGRAGEERGEAEQEDEFNDLYKALDVTDLSSHERTFIKRLEQLGYWRKKFVYLSD